MRPIRRVQPDAVPIELNFGVLRKRAAPQQQVIAAESDQ
jgi:hypothetical protein